MSAVLTASIVCYASEEVELKNTLTSLIDACSVGLAEGYLSSISVILVDNGPLETERRKIEILLQGCREQAGTGISFSIVGDGSNIGFGAGHNLALDVMVGDFHLILNPDVELTPNALSGALLFMRNNSECGLLAPAVVNKLGAREYLCKRYPSVFDLALRGFAPRQLRRCFERRLAHYEMREIPANDVYWDPPIISGCFMLLRSDVMRKLGGFDPAYFLYFEDFDLSLRAAKISRIAFVPSVRIVHSGGYAARKGWRHIKLFAQSAITFFRKHGWRWL